MLKCRRNTFGGKTPIKRCGSKPTIRSFACFAQIDSRRSAAVRLVLLRSTPYANAEGSTLRIEPKLEGAHHILLTLRLDKQIHSI